MLLPPETSMLFSFLRPILQMNIFNKFRNGILFLLLYADLPYDVHLPPRGPEEDLSQKVAELKARTILEFLSILLVIM